MIVPVTRPNQYTRIPQTQPAGKQPHHHLHSKCTHANLNLRPSHSTRLDPDLASDPRDQTLHRAIPMSTAAIPEPTVVPSTDPAAPTSVNAMPIPPAVMLVLTVAVATLLCMCVLWCLRRCGRAPTEAYDDEYEAVEAAGYRPYTRNGGSSPTMIQISRPLTTTSRHSMLDPSPIVGHQMLDDDDQDDIFLHMRSQNRGLRYSRPRSYPDWHTEWQHQPRDRPSRRQGGRTPLPVYSVIMSPSTAANTANLLQRELELLHQARQAGIVLRGPPTYDEAVGTSIGSTDGDGGDDDDGLVYPQAAAAAAAASASATLAAASAEPEQDLSDGELYHPPAGQNFAVAARPASVRTTSTRVPAPPPPSSASSIASYHLDADNDENDMGDHQGVSESRRQSPRPSPRPSSVPGEPSRLAQSLTMDS